MGSQAPSAAPSDAIPATGRWFLLAREKWFPFAVIALVCALLWGKTVTYGFVWDDKYFVQNLESVRSLSSAPAMFTSLDAQSSYPEGFKLFRPLRTLQYALLYRLGGKPAPQPWIYHLANVLWHGAAAMLFYTVCLRLFAVWAPPAAPGTSANNDGGLNRAGHEMFALWAALAFLVHPVVTEVVCWAKSLDDAMATTFCLASVLTLLPSNGRTCRAGAAVLWYTAAIYSKISAVPLLFLVYALLRIDARLSRRAALLKTLPFVLAAAVFMVHRRLVIGQSAQTAPISGTYAQTLVDTVAVLPTYLRLVLGIPPFFIDYSFLVAGNKLYSAAVLGGAAIIIAAVVMVIRTFRTRDRQFIAFGLCWFGVFMLPVSNLLPMMQYIAERFLYLPILGLIFIAAACRIKPRSRPASAWMAAAPLVIWSVLAWNRAPIWRDEVTLFVTSAMQYPGIPRVELNAEHAIFELSSVRALVRIDHDNLKLIAVPGATPAEREAAEQILDRARKAFPDNFKILTADAMVHAQTGDAATARRLFLAACSVEPANPDAWANLGEAELDGGRVEAAIPDFDRTLKVNPDHLRALRGAASANWRLGDYKRAAEVLQRLARLEPANTNHQFRLDQARARLTNSPPRN